MLISPQALTPAPSENPARAPRLWPRCLLRCLLRQPAPPRPCRGGRQPPAGGEREVEKNHHRDAVVSSAIPEGFVFSMKLRFSWFNLTITSLSNIADH